MKRSVERILTTHTGSLPRPPDLVELLHQREDGKADARAVAARVRDAVREIVEEQVRAGVDVVNDGEVGKIGYSTYVKDRLTGFEGESGQVGPADLEDYPEYGQRFFGSFGDAMAYLRTPACVGPIAVKDRTQLEQDIENLKAATASAGVEEVFMSAASPGVIALFFPDRYYGNREDYLQAIAAAMREEYRAIADAGFILQLDCPDLAMGRHIQFGSESLEEFRRQARLNVEALNEATEGIDPDRMRIHLCWGNYEGPHHRDVALRDVIDIVFEARPNGISFEACNPRHEHEWAIFEDVHLPDGKVLIPGVIDSTNNYIEHPELVAQRIGNFARLVGRENVIAGTDCGFDTFAGLHSVDPKIAWAKLRAMADGAAIATEKLGGRPVGVS